MSHRTSFTNRVPKSAFGLAVVGLTLCGLAFANTDLLLERGFERALARSADAQSPTVARLEAAPGSEDFWLRKPRPDGGIVPTAAKPLSAGDRISVVIGGVERVLEVASVSAVPDALGRAVGGAETRRFVLVACRDAARSGDAALVRLVLDANGGWPVLIESSAPRAL